MAFIYDLIDPQELLGYVRTLSFAQFSLVNYLPPKEVRDIEYRFARATLNDQDVALYRAFDAEAGIAKRQGLTRVRGELPPISRKIRLGEEERLRLMALESGDNAQVIDQIYDDAANMTRAVQARLEKARGEALYAAKVTISENGVEGDITFGRAAGHSVVPAVLWSTYATADPVKDILTWVATYVATNGIEPGFMIISTTILNDLLQNDKIRQLAASVNGAPAIVARQILDQVFVAYGLPPFVVYDTTVRVDGVSTRTIPSDRVVFMPPADEPLGNTFFGVTAEALELREAGQIASEQTPGIVAVIEKTFDPVARWTKAAAIAVPIIANPDLTLMADVR